MSEKTKTQKFVIAGVLMALVFGVGCFGYFGDFGYFGEGFKKPLLVDCSKPLDVVYLRPSELSEASAILKGGLNRVVVIPELNQVNANTDLLKCEGTDLNGLLSFPSPSFY